MRFTGFFNAVPANDVINEHLFKGTLSQHPIPEQHFLVASLFSLITFFPVFSFYLFPMYRPRLPLQFTCLLPVLIRGLFLGSSLSLLPVSVSASTPEMLLSSPVGTGQSPQDKSGGHYLVSVRSKTHLHHYQMAPA